MSELSLDRELGRYYTPNDVAEVLVDWAINGEAGALLDPSYGGCSFLAAGLRRLQLCTNGEAPGLIHGVDLDPEAKQHGNVLLARGVPTTNLRHGDFLTLTPEAFGKSFRCVVGNPPYIRHHWLDDDVVREARAAAEDAGCRLPRTANSWAYFAVLSARLLARSGRIAMLIPTSGLQADYASPVLEFFGSRFRQTRLLPLRDSLFRDTRERVTVLLADGWQGGPGPVVRHQPVERADLRPLLASGTYSQRGELHGEPKELVERVMRQAGWSTLGELAHISIGIVTGANRFFVRRPSELGRWVDSDAIIATSRAFQGLVWGAADVRELIEADAPCRLIDLPRSEDQLDDVGWEIVEAGESEGIDRRSHCRKRDPWWAVSDRQTSDAFLQYMASGTPRIVLNDAASLCTNAIHRLNWRSSGARARAVVASSCTSLFELACELTGRSYSGGVLKLEPSAARLLPVAKKGPVGLMKIDERLRAGDHGEAREVADTALLRRAGVAEGDISAMRDLTARLRDERRRQSQVTSR